MAERPARSRAPGAAGGDELLTVAQVAERLQVNPETVRRWLRTGRLRGVSLGHRGGYRVSGAEYRRFLAEAPRAGAGAAPEGKALAA
jgi:excisionase family DNA binding protein